MDFVALPPEINSARMYAGPGAAPMMAAATAWNGLGTELANTAALYESVIATLTDEEWQGPASAAMASAVAPYVAWMNATAAALDHAGSQAAASAAAYEAAFAMTVPPAVVAENRAQQAMLIATNILGQNTPAIAANEALYGEMWVQDATAMYGYAAASANAGALTPLTSPNSPANPGGTAGQTAAVAQAAASTANGNGDISQLVSQLPNAVQQLANPLAQTAQTPAPGLGFLGDLVNTTQNIGIWNGLQTYLAAGTNIAAWQIFAGVASAIGLGSEGVGTVAAGGSGIALMDSTIAAAPVATAGAPVLASAGSAAGVGQLSVPPAWSASTSMTAATAAAANTASAESAGLVTTHFAAPAEEAAGMTAVPAGFPAGGAGGRGGFGLGGPRYGVKPTVMPRAVGVG